MSCTSADRWLSLPSPPTPPHTHTHTYIPYFLSPSESLGAFSLGEVRELFCGHQRIEWTAEELENHIVVVSRQGGLSRSDGERLKEWIIAELVEMDAAECAQFVQFVTSSPALPIGGLSELRPCISLDSHPTIRIETACPQAITCRKRLLLPPYKSREMLAERLRMAMSMSDETLEDAATVER